MRQPRWFWSDDEEVQPPSRDGWTLELGDVGGSANLANEAALRAMRVAAPHTPKLKNWLCDSLQRRA